MIAPDILSIVNPANALYVPLVYIPVPVNTTGCAVTTEAQKGVA